MRHFLSVWYLVGIGVLLFAFHNAFAQCFALHGSGGGFVQVRERPGPSPYWAHASWDPDGWPAITYGPAFGSLPFLMQQFTHLHECMHLSIPTTNEVYANCQALIAMRQRGLSFADENFIAQQHAGRSDMQVLPPQYGGSGLAFWNATITCAGPRQ